MQPPISTDSSISPESIFPAKETKVRKTDCKIHISVLILNEFYFNRSRIYLKRSDSSSIVECVNEKLSLSYIYLLYVVYI